MTHRTPDRSVGQRISARSLRDMEELDQRGRLGDVPRPSYLAVASFVAMLALGLGMFTIGATDLPPSILPLAVVGMLGISVAVWAALATAQFRSLVQLDDARKQLLKVYEDLDQERALFTTQRHDANAVIAGMGAAFYALDPQGTSPEVVRALNSQLVHLRGVLSAQAPDIQSYSSSSLLNPLEGFVQLHGGKVEIDLPENIILAGSQPQTSRILQNLLDNAFKYGPRRGTHVGWELDGQEFIRIFVIDRGPGVELAVSEFIFDEGARSNSSSEGLGLGLAISRRLAESQGGALWYEPAEGGGSRFVLKLRRSMSGAPT